MRVALINPRWSFDGSIYFGCREHHLPLELGYCKALLTRDGHEVLLLDGQLSDLSNQDLANAASQFEPHFTVVTTAPTYLFWRCAQPELRVPREFLDALGDRGGLRIAVGPHGSVTPRATMEKLGVDVIVRGECEEIVALIVAAENWKDVPSIAFLDGGEFRINGLPHASRFVDLPALEWPAEWIARHGHHHHRFDGAGAGPGAEVEASRGCPYSCSFCAKNEFRDKYRRRDLNIILEEVDGLIRQGATYVYFIDEIFLPQKQLLEALCERNVQFGIQTRIDLWKPEMLDLLGRAGCVSIEAGVESLTEEGRDALMKQCKLSTDELADRLIYARRSVPFVQANLIEMPEDEGDLVARWRQRLNAEGVWANDPVPLYPYPSSPDYHRLWGRPDDRAWERAHEYYLTHFHDFSDIQEEAPRTLGELESCCRGGRS